MYFKHITALNVFILLFCSFSAQAYIGPGMSGGAIIAVLGFVIAIFAALFGLVYLATAFFSCRHRKMDEKWFDLILYR